MACKRKALINSRNGHTPSCICQTQTGKGFKSGDSDHGTLVASILALCAVLLFFSYRLPRLAFQSVILQSISSAFSVGHGVYIPFFWTVYVRIPVIQENSSGYTLAKHDESSLAAHCTTSIAQDSSSQTPQSNINDLPVDDCTVRYPFKTGRPYFHWLRADIPKLIETMSDR